ncbi:uncharacterized protein MCAP_0864-like [Haliotis cracherodii]|uniref:uncharacterized protein MCAP_0864-like n=1 Tax=Haliotis cracherodii TaxID=6455 RepID=UPI0039E83FDA
MSVAVVFLCNFLIGTLSGLILPMTKVDGSADISSIINHVASLEHTVTGLQTTTGQLKTDLQTSRALQQSANREIAYLKDEVASLKADLRLSTEELKIVKAELKDVKQGNDNFQMNQTGLDSISLVLASNLAQVNTVQSEVRMFSNQLNLINSTLYDVKREADGFIRKASPIFQLIAQSQLIENMKSAKVLAQNTSNQIAQLAQDMNTTTANMLNATHVLQSVNADLQTVKNNISLTSSDVTTLKSDMAGEKKQSFDNKQSLTQISQTMQSLMGDLNTTKGNMLNVTHNLQSVNAHLQTVERNLSLTNSDVTALKINMADEKKQSFDNKQSLTQISQTMQSLMGDLNTTKGKMLHVTNDLQSVNADLQTVERNLSLTNSDVTAFKIDMADEKKQTIDNKKSLTQMSQTMQSFTGDLRTIQNNLGLTSSDVRNLKRNMSTLAGQISSFRPEPKTPNIAFNVYHPTDQVPGADIIFDFSLYNAGSCYNTSTGKFTAPVSGTYMFWTQLVLTESDSNTYMYIMKTGGWMAMDTDIKDNHASMMVINHVFKGNDVWVTTSSSHNIAKPFPSSHFGGVLLSVD